MTVPKLQDIVQLDGIQSVEDARLTLELAISHAVPDSEQGCHAKRAILKCLLRRGLAASTSKGTFVQRSVHIAQLGEEMKQEASASSLVAASISLYENLSRAVQDFALGEQLVSIVTVATHTRHVVLKVRRLKQLREAAGGMAPASDGAASIFSGSLGPATSSRPTASTAGPSTAQVLCTAVITCHTQAQEAVSWLLQQEQVALDTEGDLERNGSVCLVQVHATRRTYIFDLHASLFPRQLIEQLARLLEERSVVKVMHDCRKDGEALFYIHGIRVQGVWDTQVASGWIRLAEAAAKGSGSGAGSDNNGSLLVGMNSLLQAHGLPPNPHKTTMHRRMDREPDLWTKRPLEQSVLDYAVADVDRLLQLLAAMVADLGKGGDAAVLHLSKAYCEWFFDESDRSYTTPVGSYAAAVKLPTGCDLQLHIDAQNGYRPRFSAFLEPVPPSGKATHQGGGEEAADEGAAAILGLFSDSIREGIERLCGGGQPATEQTGLRAALGRLLLGKSPAPVPPAPVGGSGSGGGASSSTAAGTARAVRRQPIEIVVDQGRPVTVRFSGGEEEDLSEELEIEEALERLAEAKHRLRLRSADDLFFGDNRTGIPGTLHRISAMRGRQGRIYGLTYRIGRHVPGVADLIMDILAALSAGHPCAEGSSSDATADFVSASLLLLGPPGVGKTTLLRDISNHLANTFRKRVIVVDTSNEIAGDGDVAHACIGRARRMMVPERGQQHTVMVEAVQNHNPEVMVIDEIGSSKEVTAAKSIAQRGVVIVGTAHGTQLEGLLKNPELNSLVGGMHQVISDTEAKATNSGSKTRTERKGAPTFSTLVEVLSYNRWRVHLNVGRSVDAILAGREPHTQLRWQDEEGRMMVRVEGAEGSPSGANLGQVVKTMVGEQQGSKGATLPQLVNLAALY